MKVMLIDVWEYLDVAYYSGGKGKLLERTLQYRKLSFNGNPTDLYLNLFKHYTIIYDNSDQDGGQSDYCLVVVDRKYGKIRIN